MKKPVHSFYYRQACIQKAYNRFMKRFILFFFLTTFGLGAAFSQSNYTILSNRVLLSAVVNNDTLILENLKNEVRLNGQMGLLEITYDNLSSRIVGETNQPHPDERTDVVVKFWNEYSWLEDRLKTSESSSDFMDELIVDVNGMEQTVQSHFIISRIRGAQGFTSMIEITGKFSPDSIEEEFSDLMFRNDLGFKIILSVRVFN